MATVDASGVRPVRLPENLQKQRDNWQTAFGATLNVAEETPQGQIIGILAEARTKVDETLASVESGRSIQTATGVQLDDMVTILGIKRNRGTQTIANLEIQGAASGTVIPKGTEFVSGDVRFLSVFLTKTPNKVPIKANQAGAIAPTDIKPVNAISGATAYVTSDVQLGKSGETDADLRKRYLGVLGRSDNGTLDAIRAEVLSVNGVYHCRVDENITGADIANYCRTNTFPDRSIYVFTDGGLAAEINAAIARSKPIGIPWKHSRGTIVDIAIRLSITASNRFPGDGVDVMGTRIYEWIKELWTGQEGGGLDFGYAIDVERIKSVAYSIPGHTISSVSIVDKGQLALTPVGPCVLYRLDRQDVDITVS